MVAVGEGGATLLDSLLGTSLPSLASDAVEVSENLTCDVQIGLFIDKNVSFSLLNMTPECILALNSYSTPVRIIVGLILAVIVIGTCLGNILVITAVSLVKRLQNPSNLLIVSLACSDLLVSVLVLPLAVVYQLLGYFPFAELVCDFWTSCDVLLCTSSILNLCAISIDRYLVITKPFQYAVKRTPRRMGVMIASVWLLSAFISIPPMLGWKDIFVPGFCTYSEYLGYQIYATFGAFYLPLFIMLFLYGNIFRLARRMAEADARQKFSQVVEDRPQQENNRLIKFEDEVPNGQATTTRPSMQSSSSDLPKRSQRTNVPPKKKSNSDTKAIKTLGVIMGCFTLCWLPFFIIQLVTPIYKVCTGNKLDIPRGLFETFLWLGYVNSFMNPIIYAKFNRDFRTPFKHILLCHCKSINTRIRSESFAEQYGLKKGKDKQMSRVGRNRRRSSDASANARRIRHANGAEHAV